jgi:hypothetical protein
VAVEKHHGVPRLSERRAEQSRPALSLRHSGRESCCPS